MNKKHATKCTKKPCTCDGYHTFDELYAHRVALWITLCKKVEAEGELSVWKSRKNGDGSKWFGWFILGIGKTAGTQMTYHLPANMWKYCGFAETLKKAPPFDGHTSDEVLKRMFFL